MTKKYYYDTTTFGRFFINQFISKNELPEKIDMFSPLNNDKNIRRVISPWTIEEFYHSYTALKRDDIHLGFPRNHVFPNYFFNKEIKKRTEALVKINSFVSIFDQDKVETRMLNNIFLSLISLARVNNILTTKKAKNKINSKDLLHVAYAIYFECHSIVTCDQGFKSLKKVVPIKNLLSQKKLKKIIILNNDLTEIIYSEDFI